MQKTCKSFFCTVSEGTLGTFSVLFGTRFVLPCHAALLFGRVRLSPMATKVRSSSRNSCESFFSTVSKRTFGTFSVLFGTRFVLHCHAALLFGRVRLSPMATRVRSSSRNSCKSFFSTVLEGTFGTFSVLFGTRFVLRCHSVLLFGRV